MDELYPPDPPLADKLVTLRPFTMEDVPAVTTACQDREISRWTTTPWPYKEEDARFWISKHHEFWTSRKRAPLAITLTVSAELSGSVSLIDFDWDRKTASAGYWVAAPARRRGVATHALDLVCSWAGDLLGLREVTLHTMLGNVASERVAEKARFEVTGILRDFRPTNAPDRSVEVKSWTRRLGV
jgi:RimJ/RimL family protein N-acetyltransferase